MSDLQERIAGRLDALGLTQITAATKAGLPRDTLRNLFRQGSDPTLGTLVNIARALDVSVGWLAGEGEFAPLSRQQRTILRIQERIAALGLSQHGAAQSADLHKDFVRDVLRGRVQEPSAYKMLALSKVLECELTWLLGD